MTMRMREEHAEWAHQIRREIDQQKAAEHQQLDLGITERRRHALDEAQELAGEENQDPGSWDAA